MSQSQEQKIIIKTKADFLKLFDHIEQADQFVALDTETTGLNRDCIMIGFSISTDVNIGFYVVLRSWDKETQSMVSYETIDIVEDFLIKLKTKELIMHNAIFDCMVIKHNYGVDLIQSVHTDTMVLAHLLDENRSCKLKDLGVSIFGEDAKLEQLEMIESIKANGGETIKSNYELYKADADLIAKYGAKDTILTLKLFYEFIPQLYEQGLENFFYVEESMPLLRGPTFELNYYGLKIDIDELNRLEKELEAECLEFKSFIYKEITPYVQKEYPGTNKKNTFNIGSSNQLAWLLCHKLKNIIPKITDAGRDVSHELLGKLPYSVKDKVAFIQQVIANKGNTYKSVDKKNKKASLKKIRDYWAYIAIDKEVLVELASKYKWVEVLLKYKKNQKLLETYIQGMKERLQYGIIYPSFNQIGTTSGRYSSKNPNFQNLPRDDKRIKKCIIARPGYCFVGADESQLEPRVFASFSNDKRLMECFDKKQDFYSVIGANVFKKSNCSLMKDDKNSFAKLFPVERQISKTVGLSATYGTTPPKLAKLLKCPIEHAAEIIHDYFDEFYDVYNMMLSFHEEAKKHGMVKSLTGRPRRINEAMNITKIYGDSVHSDLPYEARNLLNLAVNYPIQSTSASIINRAMIRFYNWKTENKINCRIVSTIHDEIIVECLIKYKDQVAKVLQDCMENTVKLPGVKLEAKPIIANNFADLK